MSRVMVVSQSLVPATRIHIPSEDIEELGPIFAEILRTGQLTLGKHTAAFETEFSKAIGVSDCVAVSSGTSALEIILRALHIMDKDIVVPTNTFAATAFAVVHSGNHLVLGDVGKDLCLSTSALESVVTPNTKAVILVHIGGLVAVDTENIARVCGNLGIVLIEDAAHAHGSRLNGQNAGTLGTASAFSFYPTKVITTAEGGMVVTSRPDIATTARILRDQGKAGFSQNLHVEMGYNWRMSELHAALGRTQLRRLEEFRGSRRRIAQVYEDGLRGMGWIAPLPIPPNVESNYYKFIALLEEGTERAALKTALREKLGIALAGEVYDTPLHNQPIFEKTAKEQGTEFPGADDLCSRHICLPMSAVMTDTEARRVVDSLDRVRSWLR
jgi:perosamine synthetase